MRPSLANGPITFEVPGRPVPKARPRLDPRSGRFYTPTKTQQYERLVAHCAWAAGVRLKSGMRVRVSLHAFLGRRPHPDPDNLLKAVVDGIQRANPEWNDRDAIKQKVEVHDAVANQQFARITVEVLP